MQKFCKKHRVNRIYAKVEGTMANGSEIEIPSEVPQLLMVMRIVYAVVFTAGTLGNAYVLFQIYKQKSLHTSSFIFVGNQCFLSFFVSCAYIMEPLLKAHIVSQKAWCHSLVIPYGLNRVMAPYVLLLLSIERYIIIVKPHHRSVINSRKKIITLAILWILTAILIILFIKGTELKQKSGCDLKMAFIGVFSEVFLAITCYIIPMTLTMIFYALIALNFRQKSTASEKVASTVTKLARTFFFATVCHSILWFPYTVLTLIMGFAEVKGNLFMFTGPIISNTLMSISTGVNAWVYIWFAPVMRDPILAICMSCIPRKCSTVRNLGNIDETVS